MEKTCSLHVLHLWYRGTDIIQEKRILFDIKEKELHCEDNLYRLFIIVRGTNTSRSPLMTLCYSPFLWTFIYWTIFHSFSIFQQVYYVGERQCYYMQ